MTSNLRVPRVNTLLYSFTVPFSILRLMTSTFNHTITGHCSYMSDNETKEDTSTPTMTKEEGFRAFVDKLDFLDDKAANGMCTYTPCLAYLIGRYHPLWYGPI